MANVLVIGATSAVAGELARRFAENGDKLFLIGRNKKKLRQLEGKLFGQVAGSIAFDFNLTEQSAAIIDEAYVSLGSIDKVIIAHGYLGDQLKSEVDFQHAFDVIHTNYLSVIALLIPIVQRVKKQPSCKIAVLLSVAGERGRPRNFTYGSAKGALNLYLQGLRSSLYHSGVEIYSFKLGPIDSPMTVDHEKNFSFSTVDQVADLIVTLLKGKRYSCYVPGYWMFVMWVVRWLPEPLFQRLKFLSER